MPTPRKPAPAAARAAAGPSGLAESVCLALVAEGVTHGWAIGTLLAPDGELGRIWTLSRPLTYRAVDGLVERRLVTRRGTQTGRGRERSLLEVTAAGRRAARAWLDAPVEHLRDMRTELLVKLALRARAGLPVESLLAAQSAVVAPMIDALTAGPPSTDLVDLWRRESARAAEQFLRAALASGGAHEPSPPQRVRAGIGTPNQLAATVRAVTEGDLVTLVEADLPGGQRVTAMMAAGTAAALGIGPGAAVVLAVHPSDVLVVAPS